MYIFNAQGKGKLKQTGKQERRNIISRAEMGGKEEEGGREGKRRKWGRREWRV
jgi:hypothetical protein